jgi:hypothetical protein
MDNGRYGGGSGGPEHRHHFPAADSARFDEATTGAVVKSAHHGEMPERIPAAKANTMEGGRGMVAGAKLSHDRGGF